MKNIHSKNDYFFQVIILLSHQTFSSVPVTSKF
jgi:hypothetical protein